MLDFNLLFEFSRNNCVAFCAFLVPANLLATTNTLVLVFLQLSIGQIRLNATLACILALIILFHVGTWLMIGVVMIPTFILPFLAVTCLVINFWAIIFPSSLQRLLKFMWRSFLPQGFQISQF